MLPVIGPHVGGILRLLDVGLVDASYRKRGQMPEPDGQLGGRWWWWSDTITAWAATRRPITNRARMSH